MQQIHKLGVLSVAKIMGVIYGVMGLLFVPFMLIVAAAGAFSGDKGTAIGATAFAAVVALLMPVIYGVMGFLMGGLMAFLYNLFAARVGGIEIELSPPRSAVPALSGPPVSA